jgi:hypothetical protein
LSGEASIRRRASRAIAATATTGLAASFVALAPQAAQAEESTPSCTTICYVGIDGDDSASGVDSANALRNIQTAVNQVSNGGTIIVGAGTYHENVGIIYKSVNLVGSGLSTILRPIGLGTGTGIDIIGSQASGTLIKNIAIEEYKYGIVVEDDSDGDLVTDISLLDLSTNSNAVAGINYKAAGAARLTVDSVTASNNGSNLGGIGILVTSGAKSGVSITNSAFSNNSVAGVVVDDGSVTDLTISGNTAADNEYAGMVVSGPQGPEANVFSDNTVSGPGRLGIEVDNATGNGALSGPGSVVVKNNSVTGTSTGTDPEDRAGIAVLRRDPQPETADQPSGVVVTSNAVTSVHRAASGSTGDGFGIVVEGTGMKVDHNTVSNSDVGIQVQASNTAGVQGSNGFDLGNATSGQAVLNRNSITGNTVGVRDYQAPLTDATCNWWGNANGPSGDPANGSGDPVAGSFTVAPWLTSSNLDGACTVTVSTPTTRSVTEGNSDVTVTVPVTISERSAQVSVPFTLIPGSAKLADYQPITTSPITFGPGDPTTKNISIRIIGDTTDEPNETFQVKLGAPTGQGAVLGNPTTKVTIVDNDAAPSLTANDSSLTEGQSGTHQMHFRVQLSEASAKTVTVKFATADGSAKSASDFYSRTGSLTFTPGQTVKDVYVNVRGDRRKEPSEVMFLNIYSAHNAAIADSNASGVIRNDD